MSNATDSHIPSRKFLFNARLYMFFKCIQFHGRKKMSVRQMRQSHFLAADPYKFFDIGIPLLNILITNRPVNRDTFFCIGFKIEVAPPVTLFSPNEGSATNLVSANPIKTLDLTIRIFGVVSIKMFVR